jgi:hypothetical protein
MVNPSPLGPGGNASLNPSRGITPGQPNKPDSAEATGGPAFHALLEKLQQSARSLSADSEKVEKPDELSGAVDRARSTLNDALSLSDQLLEAYRQADLGKGSDGQVRKAQ